MSDPVACLSGGAYADRPVAVRWDEQWVRIETIIERWRTPQGKGFRVRADEGQIFNLFYDEPHDSWRVEME